jgi:hypothetical protein
LPFIKINLAKTLVIHKFYLPPSKSNTAAVIPNTPVLIVGSGMGANTLECRDGNG